eukprot:TRINITY_DN47907_c0_g1_i1.p1 TRINITY_DN47907_c0_g1~~TRINITY_DN47907_c0_g1_i1.p1  ORF type:complete len:381 (-),score=37.07 TRINITY_DN47907_c0_g1_i1:118-1260(-)
MEKGKTDDDKHTAAETASRGQSKSTDQAASTSLLPPEPLNAHARLRRRFQDQVLGPVKSRRWLWRASDFALLQIVLQAHLQEDLLRQVYYSTLSQEKASSFQQRQQVFFDACSSASVPDFPTLLKERGHAINWTKVADRMVGHAMQSVGWRSSGEAKRRRVSCEHNYSAATCQSNFMHFVDPTISQGAFSGDEIHLCREAAARNEGYHWDDIARAVGRSRTGWQCILWQKRGELLNADTGQTAGCAKQSTGRGERNWLEKMRAPARQRPFSRREPLSVAQRLAELRQTLQQNTAILDTSGVREQHSGSPGTEAECFRGKCCALAPPEAMVSEGVVDKTRCEPEEPRSYAVPRLGDVKGHSTSQKGAKRRRIRRIRSSSSS